MAILDNPITLPFSKMVTTMTTLIGDIRFDDTLAPSDLVNDLVSAFRNSAGKVDYGKGIVHTFKVAPQPVKELSKTSTATTTTLPNVIQETIIIDKYNFVPISVSDILSRDAVLSGNALNSFFSFVMSLLEDTAQFHLYNECNAILQGWVPGQATQTVNVPQIDTTGLTGTELNAALQWNGSSMAKVMRKTLNNMKVPNTKYTDVAKYTDVNTGTEGDVMSALRTDNLQLFVNDNYWTNFLADTLASLYHSERVGEMIPGTNFVLLPSDAMTTANATTIGWLADKVKFSLADFYRVALSWLDPSTTYQNTFFHFSYGTGVFKYAPGVKFVAQTITPAQAASIEV